MAKRIAICLDGTWNQRGQTDDGVETKTNVLKLYEALAAGPDQVATYVAGVGTQPHEKVSGGVLGWGLFEQIKLGYRFLVDRFEPGDSIYLFGFSRGAYSARSLAGMIARCGVLKKENARANLDLPPAVAELLTTQQDGNLSIDNADRVFALYKYAYDDDKKQREQVAQFKRRYCHDCDVRLMGVWDTVGSLGIPDGLVIPGLKSLNRSMNEKLFGFLDTTLSSRVQAAYHAVAIDENRKPFLPTLWTDTRDNPARVNVAGSSVEQVWFVGAHSNVGGGYRDSGLSDITLKWMIDRATANGLSFLGAQLAPQPTALRRDPLDEFLDIDKGKKNWLLRALDKGMNWIKRKFVSVNRKIGDGACIHGSVDQRLASSAAREPGGGGNYKPPSTLKLTTVEGVRKVNVEKYRLAV